jgi:hypothetical protein
MFTVPGSRDIEPPREGQSILAWAIEATRRLNRRIHGEMVVESFGDVLIRTPELPDVPEPLRGTLTEDLVACGSAQATAINITPSGDRKNGATFTVYDALNKVAEQWDASVDADGNLYLPAGTCFDCHWKDDAQRWEIDTIGLCSCGSQELGSEETGSQEEAGSEETGSYEEGGSQETGSQETGSQEGSQGTPSGCTPAPSSVMGLPIENNPDYVLGIKNGCWVLVPLGCGGSSGGG